MCTFSKPFLRFEHWKCGAADKYESPLFSQGLHLCAYSHGIALKVTHEFTVSQSLPLPQLFHRIAAPQSTAPPPWIYGLRSGLRSVLPQGFSTRFNLWQWWKAEHMGHGGRLEGGTEPWEAWWECWWAMVQGWAASWDAWNNWEESSLFRAAQMEGGDCRKVPWREASDKCLLHQSNFGCPNFFTCWPR